MKFMEFDLEHFLSSYLSIKLQKFDLEYKHSSYWWLRSAFSANNCFVCYIDRNAGVGYDYAHDSIVACQVCVII